MSGMLESCVGHRLRYFIVYPGADRTGYTAVSKSQYVVVQVCGWLEDVLAYSDPGDYFTHTSVEIEEHP
jgi:hypothetical protein